MPECQIKRKRDLGRVKWRKRETGIVSIAHTHTHIHTHTHTQIQANTQDTLAQKVHLPETLTLEVVDGMDLQENHEGITNFDPGNTPLV